MPSCRAASPRQIATVKLTEVSSVPSDQRVRSLMPIWYLILLLPSKSEQFFSCAYLHPGNDPVVNEQDQQVLRIIHLGSTGSLPVASATLQQPSSPTPTNRPVGRHSGVPGYHPSTTIHHPTATLRPERATLAKLHLVYGRYLPT